MEYNYLIVGKVIKRLRQERRLSQDVLSGLAGIGRSHLAMIETGKKNANVETLWKIADAMNMRLSCLFKIIEDEILHSLAMQEPQTNMSTKN